MKEGAVDDITLCTAVPIGVYSWCNITLCTCTGSCVRLCTAVYSWCNVANGLFFNLSNPARAAQGPLYAREGGGMFLFPATAEVGVGLGRIVALYHRPSTLYHIF